MDLVKPIAFLKTYWKFALVLIAAVSLSFLLGQCDGARKERHRIEAAQAKAAQAKAAGGPVFDGDRAVAMVNRGTRTEPHVTQGRALAETPVCRR